ncbi:MAG: histidinol-phosphate transaminase [Tannerellaceae bacterium]|nr:histidinol-phosphate transaminase [Tannerellaceae bacterium]
MKDLKELVRPNVWNMKPYSSARNEFKGEASVFIDANENPYNTNTYNRYPDPMQWELKKRIAELRGAEPAWIFTGNGSDEAIDLLIRAFCEPGVESILSIDPSYGMYEVSADVNNVACRKVHLNRDYSLDADRLLAAVDEKTKLIFLCSPNNPTGNDLDRQEIYKILNSFDGLVIIDEAYIDFSTAPSFVKELRSFPNLVVLQTLSKAWGAAGIRLGMAFASPEIIAILNKIKYPYNVNQLTQEKALEILNQEKEMKEQLGIILSEREILNNVLGNMECVLDIYPSDANFILVKVRDANATYDYLVSKGVIVRNRNTVSLCEGCLRITVGTPEENVVLLKSLKEMSL